MSLAKAIKIAKQSNQRFRHATLIIRGGAILAAACNTAERHAEDRAIRQLWPTYARGSTVINIRLTRRGFACARPCIECMALLRKERVRKIIYTDESGSFVTEVFKC